VVPVWRGERGQRGEEQRRIEDGNEEEDEDE
jgi:hypothetical protein